ncbi:uncharacterized protein MELLADRAFT_85102 [Melampsora larici-populina 98AG31]|uniref:Uncharacterized protein n=1 Tax=Melampsora larici-populina (strain 98AG31 / pathotype 3-4-7) TaxID=747676 RepID=F4SCU8_MELLP|nr:uncharacterized protein MELLADRAFT_85102 [Melampsora larici-populina 98AG31]EGF97533.1 hypothetical protein MELLADRAFT_85102 [Melampsora larici-populina 98AG31]
MKQEAITRLQEAEQVLNDIAAANCARDVAFFENKWIEQRTRQLDVMTESQNEKRERLQVMLALEEELILARDRLKGIQQKRRRARTEADRNELLSLPATVANIEEQIEAMATALGGAEFRELAGVTKNKKNALLALSLARGNLYEAKVGLVEARLRRHRHSGARLQQYLAKHLGDKTRNVRDKYNTYMRRVDKYGLDFSDAVQPDAPDLARVMAMSLDDPFWNRGELDPVDGEDEDINRVGIENFLSRRSAGEELRRIGREARQMTAWANLYYDRVVALGVKVTRAVGVVRSRLMSLYTIVKKQACKLWKQWGRDLPQQIQETATYVHGQNAQDEILKEKFRTVAAWADQEWKTLASKPMIQAEEPDMYEEAEDLYYENFYDMNGEMLQYL